MTVKRGKNGWLAGCLEETSAGFPLQKRLELAHMSSQMIGDQ